MESRTSNNQIEKERFHLHEHPWLSFFVIIVAIALSIILSAIVLFVFIGLPYDSPTGQTALGISYQILTAFVITPFVLRLPKGKRTFHQYLDDIGLSKIQPFGRLVLLALSCYVILALSQVSVPIIYRLSEGLPIDRSFFRQAFDFSRDLPPTSSSLLLSLPSVFEEVVFRGILLTVFLRKYSETKSIIFSSIGFGLMHLLGLVNNDPTWILGMTVWATIIGLFYGYVFVKTRSLLPPMIVHYLGNAFISTLTGYIQTRASIDVQILYGVTLSLGVVPVALMIMWTRFFSSRWFAHTDGRT